VEMLECHLKVAIISHEYPPFFFGGIGSYCYNLASNLARKGILSAFAIAFNRRFVVWSKPEDRALIT
jgi:hypothetical protein